MNCVEIAAMLQMENHCPGSSARKISTTLTFARTRFYVGFGLHAAAKLYVCGCHVTYTVHGHLQHTIRIIVFFST